MTYWYTVGSPPPYPWTTEQLEQICHLRRDLKLSYPKIVEELGLDVSPFTVRRKCLALLGEEARIGRGEEVRIASATYLLFEEAKAWVQEHKVASSEREWLEWARSSARPPDIPRDPRRVYREEGWLGFGDWLGTEFLPFKKARAWVQEHKVASSEREWAEWAKSSARPPDIPASPRKQYHGEGWVNWGHWLGTGRKSTWEISKEFRPFKEARAWVQEHKVASNESEWAEWAKSPARPRFIPSNPAVHYEGEGWQGYGDWLGTGRKSTWEISKGFFSFKAARAYVRSQGLQSTADWRRWSATKRPDFIPSTPDLHYKEWVNWPNWLGGMLSYRMLSYGRAKRLIRQVAEEEGWTSFTDVDNWLHSDRRPECFPRDPLVFYEDWWWGEFLGMEGFEPGGTSGHRVVGARPWQTLPSEPTPEVDPELEVPIRIDFAEHEYGVEVHFIFTQLWRDLPPAVHRIAAAVALDMAAGNMVQQAFYLDRSRSRFGIKGTKNVQEFSAQIERLMRTIIDNPHKVLKWTLIEEGFPSVVERPYAPTFFPGWRYRQPYAGVYEALYHLIEEGDPESAIVEALATLECYSPEGPLANTSLDPRRMRYRYIYDFDDLETAQWVQQCMEPWINIWWQEVLDTLAFQIPEAKPRGRFFK